MEQGESDNAKLMHTKEKQLICTKCGAGFDYKSQLKCHMRTHTGEKPYKCELCEAVFSKSCNLTAHVQTHTGEKPHICQECGVKFTARRSLKRHMRIHKGEKPFKCPERGKRLTLNNDMKGHLQIHNGETSSICEEDKNELLVTELLPETGIVTKNYSENIYTSIVVTPLATGNLSNYAEDGNKVFIKEEDFAKEKEWDKEQVFAKEKELEKEEDLAEVNSFVKEVNFGKDEYSVKEEDIDIEGSFINEERNSTYKTLDSVNIQKQMGNIEANDSPKEGGNDFSVRSLLDKHLSNYAVDGNKVIIKEESFTIQEDFVEEDRFINKDISVKTLDNAPKSKTDESVKEGEINYAMLSLLENHITADDGLPLDDKQEEYLEDSMVTELELCLDSETADGDACFDFPNNSGDIERQNHANESSSDITEESQLNNFMEKGTDMRSCPDVVENSHQQSHMLKHMEEKSFNCKECGTGFSTKGSLKRHMRTHTGDKPFKCKE